MIPEQYWTLLRRWFLLIILFAVLGAVAAPWVLPRALGAASSAASFESSATLVVAHYVSPNGLITPGGVELDDDPVANYTTSLAQYAETEQYVAGVQNALSEQGIEISRAEIESRLTFTEKRNLYRIDLTAEGDTRAASQRLAQTASDVLIARAQAEADRASLSLIQSIEEEQALYLERLAAIEATPGVPPAPTDLELQVIQSELKDLTWERERLFFNRTPPLGLVGPIESVETEPTTVSSRDMLLLGAALGLVAGWVAANVAEHFWPGAHSLALRNVEIIEAEPAGSRLPQLAERARALERRARALESRSPALLGGASQPDR